MPSTAVTIEHLTVSAEEVLRVEAQLNQDAAILFEPDVQVQIHQADGTGLLFSGDLAASLPVAWLPRGGYRLQFRLESPGLPPGG